MKVVDRNNQVIDGVTLLLTPSEAQELADSAADLAAHPEKHHHHILSEDTRSELAIAVYTAANLAGFTPELRRILEEGAV